MEGMILTPQSQSDQNEMQIILDDSALTAEWCEGYWYLDECEETYDALERQLYDLLWQYNYTIEGIF